MSTLGPCNDNNQDAVPDISNFPEKYSINLMWINSTLSGQRWINGVLIDQRYICDDTLLNRFLNQATKWKTANPEADVTIWFDSEFTTQTAIDNTRSLFNEELKDLSHKIQLRDIREIEIVKHNPDVFSDYLPVYFRIDLLKLIICLHSIESDLNEVAIFSDLDVCRWNDANDKMNKSHLFNTEAIQRLHNLGFQMLFDGCKIENQFIEVFNKTTTLNAIKVFINACCSRAVSALNLVKTHPQCLVDLGSSVYESILTQLLPLIKMGADGSSCTVSAKLFDSNAEKKFIEYDLIEHGCLPLGNIYSNKGSRSTAYIMKNDKLPSIHDTFESVLKLPKLTNVEIDLFMRNDLDTRLGNSHPVKFGELSERAPADETNTYKCQMITLNRMPSENKGNIVRKRKNDEDSVFIPYKKLKESNEDNVKIKFTEMQKFDLNNELEFFSQDSLNSIVNSPKRINSP